MTFSNKAVQSASVLISSNLESIETFFSSGEVREDVVFVGSHNSNLINLEHSINSKSYILKLQFVDSGGDSIQKLFPIDVNVILDRRKEDNEEGKFYITYGLGEDRSHWAGPIAIWIVGATYEVKPTGLDITTLEFGPSPLLSAKKDYKKLKNKLSAEVKKPTVQDVDDTTDQVVLAKDVMVNIGTYDANNFVEKIVSTTALISAVSTLVKGTYQELTDMQTLVTLPEAEMYEYLKGSIPDRIITSEEGKYMFFTSNPPIAYGIVPGEATHWIYEGPEGTVAVNYPNALTTLSLREHLREMGIEFLYKKRSPTRASEILRERRYDRAVNNPHQDLGTGEDIVIDAPPESPTNIEDIYITFGEEYKSGKHKFALATDKLFSTVQRASTPGFETPLLELSLRTENNVDILRVWKEEGYINNISPTFLVGDEFTLKEDLYGDTPASEGAMRATGSLRKISPKGAEKIQSVINITSTVEDEYALDKPKKEVRISTIFKSGETILSFKATSTIPAIAFLGSDINFLRDTKLTKEEITDFVEQKFSDITKRDPFGGDKENTLEYQNYKKLAEELVDNYVTTTRTKSEHTIRSQSDYGGLIAFISMYRDLVLRGSIEATINVTPKFEYSTGYDLKRTVGVIIRKNPSLYDNLAISNYNNYFTGLYRIVGFTHKISNDFAQSSFELVRTFYGSDVTKSILEDDVTFDAKPKDVTSPPARMKDLPTMPKVQEAWYGKGWND
jgi:hypothetical protein